ncbi:protein Skeletor, isoforms B/C-like [Amphiura filiformis]|uniref:protein Skeletor, isoforms B/C-like n=1 Tax=Amphiura filiformis TaxID=82378 RepID=UPI003B2286B0
MSQLQLLVSFVGFFLFKTGLISGVPYNGDTGQYLGTFQGQGSSSITGHDIAGVVYVLDARTLLVKEFQYDGRAPDAFFWAGSSPQPDISGEIVPLDDYDIPLKLGEYDADENGLYIILRLPQDISTYRWLSVWCQTFRVSFAQIDIPVNFQSHTRIPISTFTGTRVRADAVYIENNRQIYFENLDYDGSCNEAYYWVGQGAVDSSGYKALDDDFRANPLRSSFTDRDVTVTLPRPLTIHNISYVGIWCHTTGRSLGRITIPTQLNVPIYLEEPYLGKLLGFFNFDGSVEQNQHRVRGTIYAEDENTLFIRDFTFDGLPLATYIWGSPGDGPSPDGDILPVDGSIAPLWDEYEHDYVSVRLPRGKTINDYGSIAVYCRLAAANFGSVTVPDNFIAPGPHDLLNLGFTPRVHNVYARNVKIIDQHTFLFRDVSYDGNGPNAYFWVGVGNTPDEKGWKAYWQIASDNLQVPDVDEISRRTVDPSPIPYDGIGWDGSVDIFVWLPDWLTVFDIGYISLWCIPFSQNFGHIDIPAPADLNIPPYVQLNEFGNYNCEVLKRNQFHVHWRINEEEEEIEVILEGRIQIGEYLAFGISGSETETTMIGSDVVVGFIEPIVQQGGYVTDYYLSSREQCVTSNGNSRGACPDDRLFGTDDVEYEYAAYYEGIATISYTRPLDTGDIYGDKVIPTDRDVYIAWAIGPIDEEGRVLKHHSVPTGNHRINFGRGGSRCEILEGGPGQPMPPWPQLLIFADTPTTFRATIGQSGGRRGYEGIIGQPGWGIAWYINGLLIPVITVKRGVTYRFEVFGGDDDQLSASYHPFYITNDNRGGLVKLPYRRD